MNCSHPSDSEFYADFIRRTYSFSAGEPALPFCSDVVNSSFLIEHLPLSEVLPLSLSRASYDSIPKLFSPLDSSALEAAGILRAAGLPRGEGEGRGVLLGIADTGIDFTSPLFRNADGTTRILSLWDQSLPGSGLESRYPAESLSYGRVFSQDDINRALSERDPFSLIPSRDETGHGTALAALAAAGKDPGTGSSGAAPLAALAAVRLRQAKKYLRDFYLIPQDVNAYQEDDLMLAVRFLLQTARSARMPAVILVGLGTSSGSHRGTSPLSSYLNSLSRQNGQIIVTAAGNETGLGRHYSADVPDDRSVQEAELLVGREEAGFTMEIWPRDAALCTVGFLSPSGQEIPRIPLSSSEQTFSVLPERTLLRVSYTGAEAETGSELIFIRFQDPAPGLWKIRVYSEADIRMQFHIWLPQKDFLSPDTRFLRPDPETTIPDPGNAPSVLTVAAENSRTGAIYIRSGRGNTADGTPKPDLTAPGVSVPVPGGTFSTGTSAAAAITAGACCSLLSWSLSAGNRSVMNTPAARAFFIRGAVRRPDLSYPDPVRGYGSLNLYRSFLAVKP